jgi:hypothetical protein
MADTMRVYRTLLVVLAVGAVGATIFGGYGLYTVITGGTTDGSVAIDALGEYDCEEFDGDPEVIHNASYGVDRTLLGGSALESFNHSRDGDRLRLVFDVDGGVLGTSASRPDGTEIPVEQVQEESHIVVELSDPAPLRLWIDSVSEDATVTRTELDICPPG